VGLWLKYFLNARDPGPGDDDFKGGVLAVDVAGCVIFFPGAKDRILGWRCLLKFHLLSVKKYL